MEPEIRYMDNFEKAMAVLAAHKIAMWEYDLVTDEVSFADNYFHVLGLDVAGIHFNSVEEASRFVPPEDKGIFDLKAFKERVCCIDKNTTLRMRAISPKDGSILWLEENFFGIQDVDKQGNPRRLIFYTQNVTQRREQEAKIRRLEDRNRKIIEAMPEFIFIFDNNFFIRDVLMSQRTMLLHSVEELMGVDARKIYSSEVSELFLRNICGCLSDGQIREIEYPLDTPDKGRFYFQARIAPFEEDKVIALIHDIGDRMQREVELEQAKRKAEESDRMKSLFLANMSHEIRTPLNAIIGFSDVIAVTDDPQEREQYAEIIQKNSNLLLQLINDILDLSRIESGKSEMIFQPTELSGLIDEIEKTQQLKMNGRVEFSATRPNRKIWVDTDRNRVMQVMFNFLSNAVKNTEKGAIRMGVEQDGEWLRLYVSDTGCGIPEEKLPNIFGRFEKLDEFKSGTGLGLAICQSIAEGLGGRIDVTSHVGEGSTFALIIPVRHH